MARVRSDLPAEVRSAVEGFPQATGREAEKARRVTALSLVLAGASYEQIGERLEITPASARSLVDRTLETALNRTVDQMRQLENARLDRAQAAVWSDVIAGDHKAIDVFLRISQQRARINGLNAPTQVNMNMSIKQEMQTALAELETLVLGPRPDDIEGTATNGDDHDHPEPAS